MDKDYKELYLKERLIRLKAEAEILVLRHEKILENHKHTAAGLEAYLAEKSKTKEEPKKTTRKKSKK